MDQKPHLLPEDDGVPEIPSSEEVKAAKDMFWFYTEHQPDSSMAKVAKDLIDFMTFLRSKLN